MRIPKQTCIVLALLILFTISLSAQYQAPKRTIRVSVDVGGDEVLHPQVLSKINSGLRSLGDVVLVDNDPRFKVSIVAMTNKSVGGQTRGYTLSIVVVKAHLAAEKTVIKVWAQDESGAKLITDMFGDGTILVHHSVVIAGELDDACKDAVASIDTDPIEDERKYWQDIDDNTKRYLELKKQYPNKTMFEIQNMINKEKKKP